MKNKQVTAILLSAVMAISICAPMNSMTSFAAENVAEESTESEAKAEVPIEAESADELEDQENAAEESTESEAEAEVPIEAESTDELEVQEKSESVGEDLTAEAAVQDEVSGETEETEKEAALASEEDPGDAEQEAEAAFEADTEEAAVTEEELATEEGKEAKLAGDIVDSGTCGENATWTLTGTDDNLTLTISGSGDIDNYLNAPVPWESRRTDIKTIIIEDGIINIGEGAFDSCTSLTSVTIPDSVKVILQKAFGNCSSLTEIVIPKGVTYIGICCFSNCNSLREIKIPEGVKRIDLKAFQYCTSLVSVELPTSLQRIYYDAFEYCDSLRDIYYKGTKADWDSIENNEFLENNLLLSSLPNVTLHTAGDIYAQIITLNKSSATIVKGKTLQLKATVTPADATDGKVTWKSGNTNVATVTSTGTIKAVSAGSTTITAVMEGGLKASCTIKVVNPYTIKFDKNVEKKVAAKVTLTTTSKKVNPGSTLSTLPTPKYTGYYFLGWYTAKTGGTKVTVKTKPSKSMTLYAHWVKVQSIAKATVTVASCTYNTKAQKPKVTVKLGGKTLKEGTDYTLTYANNKIASRKAVVTVKGKNAYKASVKKLFTISQRDISKSPVSIKLKKTKFGYTGKAIKPGYTAAITVDGKAVNLVNGTDFKVAYKNNVRIGTASIVFTGKGNYKGTKTLRFYILKKATVTLDLNKGTGSRVTPVLPKGSQNTVEILAGEKIGKIPTPTRKGYTFVGWYTTPKATGGNLIVSGRTIFAASETKNQKIYARWKRNTYKITFKYDKNGLGLTCPFTLPKEMTYNVEKAVTLPVLTSEYAKFNGWKTTPDAVTTDKLIKKIGEKPTSGDLVLYLDYTNYEYSIEFSGGDGGSVSNGVKHCLTWFSKDTLPLVSCTPPAGKKFDKWYCTENGQYYQDGAEFDRLTTQDGTVFHFVAVWKDALGESVVEYAKEWLGKIPYGSSSGTKCDVSVLTQTDCSGFVCGVYYHFNINLWGYKGTISDSPLVMNIGTTDYNQAKPGDIIWWKSNNPDKTNGHVAIYAGGGYMVDETTDPYGGVSRNVLFRPVSEVANNRPIEGIFRVKE